VAELLAPAEMQRMRRHHFTGARTRMGSFFFALVGIAISALPARSATGTYFRTDPPAVCVRMAPGGQAPLPRVPYGQASRLAPVAAAPAAGPWGLALAAEAPFEDLGLPADEPLARTLRLPLRPGVDPRVAAAALRTQPGVEAAWVEGRFRVAWADAERSLEATPSPAVDGRPAPPAAGGFPDDPLYLQLYQWGLRNDGNGPLGGVAGADIRAEAGWAGTTGSTSLKLAIVDTGIDPGHPDLGGTLADGSARIIRAFNSSIEGSFASPYDSVGHGTLVSGVTLARTNNGPMLDDRGVAGIAGGAGGDSAGCRVIAVKATPTRLLDALGTELSKGIVYAVAAGARAINLSFGSDDDDDNVMDAISYAQRNGCVVVCGAGNGQDARPQYPGYYARWGVGVSVAAIVPDGTLAAFSSRGPQIDVAAPGQDIWSTYMTYENAYQSPIRNFHRASGTSFAAPHVTGLAGLATVLQPSLIDNEFQQLLRHTARDVGAPGRDDTYGWGIPDAGALVTFMAPPRGFLRGSASAQEWSLVGTDSVTLKGTRIAVGGCTVDGRYLAERWEVRARVTLPPGRMLETPLVIGRTQPTRGWPAGPELEYDLGWGEVVPGTVSPTGFTMRTYVYRIPAFPVGCASGTPTPIGWLPVEPRDAEMGWSAFGRLDAPPALRITQPAADGASWPVDTADTLRWEASDPDEVSAVAIDVSGDGGSSWRRVADLPGSARAHAVASPCGVDGDSTFVRVTAFDTNGAVLDQVEARRRLAPSRLCLPGESPTNETSFAFLPVSPNPARGTAVFRFERETSPPSGAAVADHPGAEPEELVIHDARGRRVRVYDTLPASPLVWDGRDDAGRRVRSGVYFARMRADGQAALRRFVYFAEPGGGTP